MIKIIQQGRTCNFLIQYLCAILISNKLNIGIETDTVFINPFICHWNKPTNDMTDIAELLKVNINRSVKHLPSTTIVNNATAIDILTNPKRYHNTNLILKDFFQIPEILLNYRNTIKDYLIDIDKNQYNLHKNDLFIHYRLGDDKKRLASYSYIRKSLIKHRHKHNKAYISTASPNDHKITRLCKNFHLKIINIAPISTIKYAMNFSNMILSAGSFSYMIGYMSNAKNITVMPQTTDPLNTCWGFINEI